MWGGDAQLGVTTLPAGLGGKAAARVINSVAYEIAGRTASGGGSGGSGSGSSSSSSRGDGSSSRGGASGGFASGGYDPTERGGEVFRATRRELRALLDKIEAHSPGVTHGMRAAYDRSLSALPDIWIAPPVPVVCIIGAGTPTHVEYGYREPWPRNMDEEPCPLRSEDGDYTVPFRSAESVCSEWQRQKRCYAPLATASAAMFKGKPGECVETVVMHCKAANMESADFPRGTDQCEALHARILGKKPVLDLVHTVAMNSNAFEPGFAPSLDQIHELMQVRRAISGALEA